MKRAIQIIVTCEPDLDPLSSDMNLKISYTVGEHALDRRHKIQEARILEPIKQFDIFFEQSRKIIRDFLQEEGL